jgi:membrane protein
MKVATQIEDFPYNRRRPMERLLRNLFRGMGRIFPDCVTLGQAIAFNMFLAFFPILLLALGLLSSTSLFPAALKEIPERLSMILPPGSTDVVFAYFVRRTIHSWRWVSLGLGGTLIAGSQVMIGFMEGFRVIEGDLLRPKYLRRQLRALGLLCLTLIPILAVIVMTVFGRQTRASLVRQSGSPQLVHALVLAVYFVFVFFLAMSVLMLVYRIGRPGHRGFKAVLPGAVVATFLWWTVDGLFGLYVRRVPYNQIYGGLAAAIGLLLWMYLTAMIVLLGAGYNAEVRESAIHKKRRITKL